MLVRKLAVVAEQLCGTIAKLQRRPSSVGSNSKAYDA